MANDLDLVSQVVMRGKHGAGPGQMAGKRVSRARGQKGGIEGPGGAATSKAVSHTILSSSFFARRGYGKVLGSGSKSFPGKTLCLHPILTSDKTTFRHHLPTHSFPCSPFTAHQASRRKQTGRGTGMFCLPTMCQDTGSITRDATGMGHYRWSLQSLTVPYLPSFINPVTFCSDKEHLKQLFQEVLNLQILSYPKTPLICPHT